MSHRGLLESQKSGQSSVSFHTVSVHIIATGEVFPAMLFRCV